MPQSHELSHLDSRVEERAGRWAGLLRVCQCFVQVVVACFTTCPLDAGGGLCSLIVALPGYPGDLCIVYLRSKYITN